MVVRYLFSVLIACVLFHPLNAQPNLLFKRVEVNYPTIRLAFKVTCDGAFRNDIQPQNFEVYENGLKVKDATLWCPPVAECCISAALVFDRSGSMVGEKLERVKEGGLAFINSMNPDGLPCDEAAIVSFSSGADVQLDVPMTTSKPTLVSAVNAMVANGRTALWDATALGIEELYQKASNRCKAVVVLTDGGDNDSWFFTHVQQVIQLAHQRDVKVYTIGFGIQAPKDEHALQTLAAATGGEYYFSADGSDLARIYASIKESIKDAYQECYITYEAGCPDGSMRTVELILKSYCGGADVARTRTYVAPRDESQFQTVGIRIGDGDVGSTKDVVVPVYLETPVNAVFSKSDISIGFDRNIVQYLSISTDGTLFEGKAVTATPGGSSVTIHLEEHIEIDTQGGVLFYLHFRAGDVAMTTFTPLYMITWAFQAYCLKPQLHNGRLLIRPREPILSCEVSAPDALNWNDQEKRYEPNPFNVSVTVYNTGTKEAYGVRAVLVTDPAVVTLVTPQVNSQEVVPRIIPPGQFATAEWTLQVKKIENLDSIPIYFSIQADNHVTQACWRRIVVDPALSSAIACEISAIDTVFFREQYYEPEEFDIHVTARNVGSGQTKDVRAQLLQDTRFTIVPPASQLLADVLLPKEEASGTFRVKIHPRDTDGYDTVRVNIQGDDTNPAWCSWPVWVQRVRMPEFSLLCTTPDDSLAFSDATYEYEPNPFVVTTVAKNIGETYAENCQIMFVGPEGFEIVGSNPRPAGTMQINDTHSEQWTVRALDRDTAAWHTLVFQVLGRGGLGRQIVIAECQLPVYVPAIRRPEYELTCTVPDSLVYENNQYQPDPFTFSLQITNVGNAAGRGLSPAIIPPPSVSLAAGETAERYVPALGIGSSTTLTWKLHPEIRGGDGDYRICAQVVDSIGITEQCCSDIFIPRTENPDLLLSCWSIDTLYIDPSSGQYLGNPFDVILDISNIGLGTADNVRATITVLGSFMRVISDGTQYIGDLLNEDSNRLTWQVEALKRNAPADIPIVLTVEADNHPPLECNLVVHVLATQSPFLETVCSSIPEDSLFFDWSVGDFSYRTCTLTFTVTNTGEVDAKNVRALLVMPSGVLLSDGEETQKPVTPSLLGPGESGVATWSFRAKRSDLDAVKEFRFIARADNADDAICTDDMFIQGSPRHVTLSLPAYTLLRYGEKRDVAIQIDSTIGKDLSEYILQFYYDPEVISILGVSNAGTLTSIGWVGARIKDWGSGHLEISDYTTGTPLSTHEGILLTLQVEGIYNNNRSLAAYGESVLHIAEERSLLNRGAITLHTIDGRAIVTNQCLEPLVASDNFVLEQNRPNPFNPHTIIEFTLPQDDHVRLVVFDRHGREIATLLDDVLKEGAHSVRFDAEDLPSGMYFYRLESGKQFEVRKMILSR